MSKVKIIFIRHGQTDHSVGYQNLDTDPNPPLNQTGIEQAEKARDELADHNFDAIYSSPLIRANKTAEIINQKHNLEIKITDELREFDIGTMPFKEWVKSFNFDCINERSDKRENIETFLIRINNFIQFLIKNHQNQTILVVAHGGVYDAFYACFHQLPWQRQMPALNVPYCKPIEFEFSSENGIRSKYPNTFYRVSAKAIIMDDQDRILMVKENSSHDLPGGGIDHGEGFKQALKRELNEEANFDQEIDFDYQILGVETFFKPNKQAWIMLVICKVNFERIPQFSVGKDADEIAFLSKQELAKLENPGAKIAYRWAFGDEKSTVKKNLIVDEGEKCD